MIRHLYSLLLLGAQPFLRRKLRRRGLAEQGYLEHTEERFGRYRQVVAAGSLWIHAVSLGETRAAAILIERLRQGRPDLRILLTHGTATGRAEGARLLRPGDLQAWLPWDTPQAVRRFLNHFKPCLGVLMETEVWPNLAAGCRAQGIPLALANARLSQQSLRKSLRLAWLARPALASLAAIWAQTEGDAQRLTQAGATVRGVFGNLKFDAAPDQTLLNQGRAWRAATGRPVVIFASSREGEEESLLARLKAGRELAGTAAAAGEAAASVQWLIVPRHPQRFDEVAALAQHHGFSVSRRSSWTGGPLAADIWLGDSLGEMAMYYGLGDAALLGGSFAPLGGQNLIEAAACGCPVVMGPHTFNFAEAAELAQQAGAARRVESLDEGVRRAAAIAVNGPLRQGLADAALRFGAAHRGAAQKTADAVLALAARIT